MRAEAPAPLAEMSVRLGYIEIRNHHRFRFNRHIDEEHYLSHFLAFIENLLIHDHDEVPDLTVLVLGKFRNRHVRHREDRVRAVEWQHVELSHDRIAKVLRRRFLCAVDKLFPLHDLPLPPLLRTVATYPS